MTPNTYITPEAQEQEESLSTHESFDIALSAVHKRQDELAAELGIDPTSPRLIDRLDTTLVLDAEKAVKNGESEEVVDHVFSLVGAQTVAEKSAGFASELTVAAPLTAEGFDAELREVQEAFAATHGGSQTEEDPAIILQETLDELQGNAVITGNAGEIVINNPEQKSELDSDAAEAFAAMKVIYETTDGSEGTKRYELAETLAGKDETLGKLIEWAKTDQVDGWDRALIFKYVTDAANRRRDQTKLSIPGLMWSFSDREVKISPEEQKQIDDDSVVADKLLAHANELQITNEQLNVLDRMRSLKKFGITFEDADAFRQRSTWIHDIDEISEKEAERIKGFKERIASVSRAVELFARGDYGGEILDILDYQDLIDDAVKDIDDQDEQRKIASTLMRFLQRGYSGEVRTLEDKNKIAENMRLLLEQGASARGITALFRSSDNYLQYLDMETSDKTKELIATITKHGNIDFGDTSLHEHGGDILGRLIYDADRSAPFIKLIDSQFDKAISTGYPNAIASQLVRKVFDQYRDNNVFGSIEDHDQIRLRRMDAAFRAMEIAGDSTLKLGQLLRPERYRSGGNKDLSDFNDFILRDITEKLYEGEDLDAEALQQRLKDIMTVFEGLDKSDPEVMEAFRHTALSHADDLGAIEAYGRFIPKISPEMTYLKEVRGDYDLEATARLVDELRTVLVREDVKEGIEEITLDRIAMLHRLNDGDAGYDGREIAGILLTAGEARAKSYVTLLESDFLLSQMKNPAMAEQINSALHTIYVYVDKINIEKDIELVRSMGEISSTYLSSLVNADGSTRNDEARELFYEVAHKVLPRRDRNGNLYDSPNSVSVAAEQYTRLGSRREDLDWFLGEDLPLAAIDTVTQYRSEAREAGIADTPTAVYEWVFRNPEKVAELSHAYLRTYVDSLVKQYLPEGKRTPEATAVLIERARELAERMDDDFRVFVNIRPESLTQVAEQEGRIHSTFEVNGQDRNYRQNYMFVRSGVEVALGIRSLNDDQDHPVYGTAGYIGDGIPTGAIGYGDVLLTYRPTEELISRASFTPEDSFHGAHRLTVEDAKIVRILKSAFGMGSMRTNEYVETQIVGGIDLDRVDIVYVADQERYDALPDVLKARARISDKITRLEQASASSSERGYMGSRERRLVEDLLVEEKPVPLSSETIEPAYGFVEDGTGETEELDENVGRA